MNNGDLERFLTRKKMKFARIEGSKHVHFRYEGPDGELSLPFVASLSRGGDEATERVFGNTARDLGVSENELKIAVGCGLSRPCLLVCLCIRLLTEYHRERVELAPDVHGPEGQKRFVTSLRTVLDDARRERARGPWPPAEADALARWRDGLAPLVGCRHVSLATLARQIEEFLDA